MNPNQGPQGPVQQTVKPFTKKALEARFSFSFTRQQLVVMTNILASQNFAVGDPRTKVLVPVLDEIDRTAFSSITASDYEQEVSIPVQEAVKVN